MAKRTVVKVKSASALATQAAEYYEVRERRLAQQREADETQRLESKLKAALVAEMRAAGVTVVGEGQLRAELSEKTIAKVVDWDQFYQHVAATGSFELLHRRVTEAAMRERWANGDHVPGVEPERVLDVAVRLKK